MSETDASAAVESAPPAPLSYIQRRVLGVLIEKAFATPESYPLTLNALISGCNQKSARDPVLSLDEYEVEETVESLQAAGLLIRVYPASGRTERFKQAVKDKWGLDRPARAVLGELLLRGAQSEGDLRGRAARLVPIESLDALREILQALADAGFVRRLSPPGRKRGVVWSHLLFSADEMRQVEADVDAADADEPTAKAPRSAKAAPGEVAELRQAVEELRGRVQELARQVEELRTAVGT